MADKGGGSESSAAQSEALLHADGRVVVIERRVETAYDIDASDKQRESLASAAKVSFWLHDDAVEVIGRRSDWLSA